MVSRIDQEADELVRIYEAPEEWARYFTSYGDHIVPEWIELADIQERRKIAADLQRILGKWFRVGYAPNVAYGQDGEYNNSMGHVLTVGIGRRVSYDFDGLCYDLREDYREQIADWLGSIAAEFNRARHRLLAGDRPQLPDDEAVITVFEAVDARGRILYRSLVESDCFDFQRAAATPCEVRRRDALLCSVRATSGGAA